MSPQAAPCTDECLAPAPAPADVVRYPRILVLLATCNGSRWIGEQLETILKQQGVELRIAIRDEGPVDAANWELGRFADHERIDIVSVPIASGSPARSFLNLVSENPAGAADFVAFSDQDDIWNPDKLARGCRMLEPTRAAGYSSATIAAWEDGRETLTEISGPPTAADFLFEGAGQGCTFVLTRDFYERVRRFIAGHRDLTDQVHYHDWLIYALARSWEMPWCFDLEPSMRYRQHAGNHTGARGSFRGGLKRLRMIRQGWYRAQLEAIAAICRIAAPGNDLVRSWHGDLTGPRSWRRRLRVTRFCLGGVRRRRRDNMIAVLAALCGWI